MIGAIEDINFIPFKKIMRGGDLPGRNRFSFYLNSPMIDVSPEPGLPEEQKEFPVDEWKMPVEPEGYIKCRDNGLL